MSTTIANLDLDLFTTGEPSLSDRIRACIGSDSQFSLSLSLVADGLDSGIIDEVTAKVHVETVGRLALELDEC